VLDVIRTNEDGAPEVLAPKVLAVGPDDVLHALDSSHQTVRRFRDRRYVDSIPYGPPHGGGEVRMYSLAVDPEGRVYLGGGCGSRIPAICCGTSHPEGGILRRLDREGRIDWEWRSNEYTRVFEVVWTEDGLLTATREAVLLFRVEGDSLCETVVASIDPNVWPVSLAGDGERTFLSVQSRVAERGNEVWRLEAGSIVERWSPFPDSPSERGRAPASLALSDAGRLHVLSSRWTRFDDANNRYR
jgi:hypothetical protein